MLWLTNPGLSIHTRPFAEINDPGGGGQGPLFDGNIPSPEDLMGQGAEEPPVQPETAPEPEPGSDFLKYEGLPLDDVPAELRPKLIEKAKLMDRTYTPAMQKFKPWTELADQGISPEQAKQALAVQRLLTEKPQEAMRLLKAMMPEEDAAPVPPQEDPLASLAEQYDPDFFDPIRQVIGSAINEAQEAKRIAQQLAEQLQKERADSEERALDQAKERNKAILDKWVADNSHLGLQPDQIGKIANEIVRITGKDGFMSGLTAGDIEAAALRVLGPEEYQKAVYNKMLQAARQKVAKRAPGPVVAPGAATAGPAGKVPSLTEDPGGAFEGAMEYIAAMQRAAGG